MVDKLFFRLRLFYFQIHSIYYKTESYTSCLFIYVWHFWFLLTYVIYGINTKTVLLWHISHYNFHNNFLLISRLYLTNIYEFPPLTTRFYFSFYLCLLQFHYNYLIILSIFWRIMNFIFFRAIHVPISHMSCIYEFFRTIQFCFFIRYYESRFQNKIEKAQILISIGLSFDRL